MTAPLRRSSQTQAVLAVLLQQPTLWSYGYQISLQTGLKSGTLYPVLKRLHERGWLETHWDTSLPGRPARHMYRLTANGLSAAQAELSAERRMPLRPPLGQEGD